jgi:hypothetical protein
MSDLASPNARISLLVLALARSAVASLPYNPTTILISPQNRRFAYLFQPSPQTSQFLFGSLDLSAGITRSTPSVKTIQASLPFLGDSTAQPFSVAIDQDGTIAIYVGNCSQDASFAKVWKYQTALPQSARSWTQLTATGVGVSPQPQPSQRSMSLVACVPPLPPSIRGYNPAATPIQSTGSLSRKIPPNTALTFLPHGIRPFHKRVNP